MGLHMTFRRELTQPKPAPRGARLRTHRAGSREWFPRVFWRIGMTGMVAFAFCQTAFESACAIGGVDVAPPPSASPETNFVAPKETRLENGLRVIVAERPELPLLSAEVLIGQGAAADPAGLAGTAMLTGELLTKGTETMTASQIANAVESLGGSIARHQPPTCRCYPGKLRLP